jgi:type IV pilus assembly protein PilY1
VNVDPQLALGTLLFLGNVPGGGACSVGGDTWVYAIDYKTGAVVVTSAGKVAGRKVTGAIGVGLTVYEANGLRSQTILSTGNPDGGAPPTPPGGQSSRRSSWRELTQ